VGSGSRLCFLACNVEVSGTFRLLRNPATAFTTASEMAKYPSSVRLIVSSQIRSSLFTLPQVLMVAAFLQPFLKAKFFRLRRTWYMSSSSFCSKVSLPLFTMWLSWLQYGASMYLGRGGKMISSFFLNLARSFSTCSKSLPCRSFGTTSSSPIAWCLPFPACA
jgi:hypothetical protein